MLPVKQSNSVFSQLTILFFQSSQLFQNVCSSEALLRVRELVSKVSILFNQRTVLLVVS